MFPQETDQAIALYFLTLYGEDYILDLIEKIDPILLRNERVANVVRTWLWNINESGDESWEDEL